jgi:hypothetical protein
MDIITLWYKKIIRGTHHDQFGWIPNPHKILGYSVLCHYMIRFGYMFYYNNMFVYENYDVIHIFVHLLLSCSSFLFPIKKQRNYENQIIWRELQLHNIVFASRSCAIMFYCIMSKPYKYQNENAYLHKFVIVMGHHIMADVVTYYYKEGTTMRNMTWNNTEDAIKPYMNKFYALAQFGATTYMIFGKNLCMEVAFSTMFAIQMSTFLMTLRFKGLIDNNTWHILYSGALLMTFWIGDCADDHIWPYYLLFYVWRIILNGNKYIGWLSLLFYHITQDVITHEILL